MIHSKYDNRPGGIRYHDIAILKIERLECNAQVRRVCLPKIPTNPDNRHWQIPATVAGWGLTRAKSEGGTVSDNLMQVRVSIYPKQYVFVLEMLVFMQHNWITYRDE